MDMVGTKYTLNRVGVDGGVHGYWVGLDNFFQPNSTLSSWKIPNPITCEETNPIQPTWVGLS